MNIFVVIYLMLLDFWQPNIGLNIFIILFKDKGWVLMITFLVYQYY